MIRPWTPGRLALALALAVSLVAGLLAVPAEAAARPKLSRGLLSVADLPRGYRAWTPAYEAYAASTNPACSKTLDELEFSTPRLRGVEYARAGFARGDFGPWVLENLRRYPSQATADRDLTRVLGVLRGCSSFQHAYSGEKPAVLTLKLTPIALGKIGSRSKAVWITANANGSWAYGEILVLSRVRGTLVVLSQLGFKRPDPKAARTLARRAAAKARTVAG
ncbi:hypothetical protein [Nonomuraea sp. LPB2021202275-12-8]|uniref:hypothetical protein n=1 Tax=Nonomuraea sp. LPB2021202275-12-8 TaxID=3120159 RepID=UPI00300D3F8E